MSRERTGCGRSITGHNPQVIAVPGDMRDPAGILSGAGLRRLIDLAEPACVILSWTAW